MFTTAGTGGTITAGFPFDRINHDLAQAQAALATGIESGSWELGECVLAAQDWITRARRELERNQRS